jgi:hypothetical protein
MDINATAQNVMIVKTFRKIIIALVSIFGVEIITYNKQSNINPLKDQQPRPLDKNFAKGEFMPKEGKPSFGARYVIYALAGHVPKRVCL